MGAVIIRILSAVFGGGVVSWVTSNLAMLGIATAVVVVTNATTGVIWYVKGYNSAAAKCQVRSLIYERDKFKKELDVQKTVAEFTSKELEDLRAREAAREQRGAEDAANIQQVPGCVVLPRSNRMRNNGVRR